MSAIYCPKCVRRIEPRGRITVKSELSRHLREDHVQDGEVMTPAPRPTDKQAKPNSYRDETCIVCGEKVRDPSWNSSTSGGGERSVAAALAGNPIHTSMFWTKRQVKLEISTWMGTGAIGASHFYFNLKEEDDCPIIVSDWGGDDKNHVTVMDILPYGHPWRGRRIDDEHDLFTRDEAIRAAIKKYLAEFDCKTHYLIHGGWGLESETRALAKNIMRQMREGD